MIISKSTFFFFFLVFDFLFFFLFYLKKVQASKGSTSKREPLFVYHEV